MTKEEVTTSAMIRAFRLMADAVDVHCTEKRRPKLVCDENGEVVFESGKCVILTMTFDLGEK